MVEIGRLLTAMITPFDAEGEVDYGQARKLAKALVDSGSDGLVIGGTTGESPSMSDEEKLRLFGEGDWAGHAAGNGPLVTGGGPVSIGQLGGGAARLSGDILHLRVSDVARSAGWIQAAARNMLSPQEFVHTDA